MRRRSSTWAARAALLALAALSLLFFLPRMAALLSSGAGAALKLLYLLAGVFAAIVLPLIVFSLLKFAYSVFLRPYWRLWRLRRFRNARYLRDAVRRGR